MSAEARSTSERVGAVGSLAADVHRATTEAELLEAAGRHAYTLFCADWIGVGLRSVDGNRLRMTALPREGERLAAGKDVPAEGLALAEAAASGSILAENELGTSAFRDLAGLAAAGMRTALVVPFRPTNALGSMMMARRSPVGFDTDDRLLASQVTALLVAAVVNLRSIAAFGEGDETHRRCELILARRVAELAMLEQLLTIVATDHDRPEPGRGDRSESVLDAIAGCVADGFLSLRGIDLFRVARLDDGGTLRLIATAAAPGAWLCDVGPVASPASPEATAIATGEPTLWRQPGHNDDEGDDGPGPQGVTSLAAVSIAGCGEPIGVLTAASVGPNRLLTDEHITMMTIVARAIATSTAGEQRPDGPTGDRSRSAPLERAEVPTT